MGFDRLDKYADKQIDELQEHDCIRDKFSKPCPLCQGEGKIIYDKAGLLRWIKRYYRVKKAQAYRIYYRIVIK